MKYSARIVWVILVLTYVGCTQRQNTIKSTKKIYYFNVLSNARGNITQNDTTRSDTIPIEIFPSDRRKVRPDDVPWADLYLCKCQKIKNAITTAIDTICILDTCTHKNLKSINPSDYWLNIEKSEVLKKCAVSLTEEEYKKAKKHKFVTGNVVLVTDD